MKKRNNLIRAVLAALLMGASFTGVGFSAPPVPAAPSVSAPSASQMTPASPLIFSYDPKGKPDPFKPFVDAEIALKKQREAEFLKTQKARQAQAQKLQPLSPLQRLGIEQFSLVGIAGNDRHRTAMVQDPAGKFYPVYKGTLLGLSGAKVTEIQENQIILEERQTVTSGKSKKKRTEVKRIQMKLHREGEEGKP